MKNAKSDARPFRERLKEACEYAGVEYSQAVIAKAFGVGRQTVDYWMHNPNSKPKSATLFHLADKLGVDAHWLATDEGEMLRSPKSSSELKPEETELLYLYNRASPSDKRTLLVIAHALVAVSKKG